MTRAAALERLSSRPFDVLVAGGGILGSRIAYDAARCGLRVALVDAGDLAGGTSSASSKLVHGGFQYLARGDARLVWESQRERRALSLRLAPHLVRPLPILLALDGAFPRPLLRAGFVGYALLSGLRERPPRLLGAEAARELVPTLRDRREWAVMPEAQTNDARLVLATARAAARAGAVVANHLRLAELVVERGRAAGAILESGLGEGTIRVRCRAVVNATGPWIDRLRRIEDPGCKPLVRLSKGTHVLLRLEEPWRAGLAVTIDRSKLTFAVPWHGMLLVGTSDAPYDGDPDAVAPTAAERRELLANAALIVPPELLAPGRIVHAFSGLRALPPGDGATVSALREHRLATGRAGVVSVAGGKLTTHRPIAAAALRLLPAELRPRSVPREGPLPGGFPWRPPRGVDPGTLAHLAGLYGSETPALLADGDLARIHPAAPDVWAQVQHAALHEWAATPDDVIFRRTTLGMRGLADDALRARVAQALASTSTAARASAVAAATEARSSAAGSSVGQW